MPAIAGLCAAISALLWHNATTGKHGGDRKTATAIKSDNVTLKPRRGNSRAYTLDRLKRERPDLFELVNALTTAATVVDRAATYKASLTCETSARRSAAAQSQPPPTCPSTSDL
jgi:hypothetical protein